MTEEITEASCPDCGFKTIDKDMVYCPKCGKKLLQGKAKESIKLDNSGHIIVAENVKLIFSGEIMEAKK